MKTAAGFSLPAEWEPQEAVWLSWPTHSHTFANKQSALQQDFAYITAILSENTLVRINADAAYHTAIRQQLNRSKTNLAHIELFDHPTNDVWCRDHGPIFLQHKNRAEVALSDWQFNAWGGKFPPWDLDNQIPTRIAESLQKQRFHSDMVLEGGAIEGNGQGLIITTESVLLNPNRNPQYSQEDITHELQTMLGIKEVLWLGQGIAGDDTDGHIDDMVRFINPQTLIFVQENDTQSANYSVLQENEKRLRQARWQGQALELIALPMPETIKANHGWRLPILPASYANFLISNQQVIVPIFEQKKDAIALGILQECFPHHQVKGVDCRNLVYEGGAIHCISQQQPSCLSP